LIDAERGGEALAELIDDDDDVAVAAITVAELRVSVRMAKGKRRNKREQFVTAVLGSVTIEPYDLDVAEAHAALLAHVRRAGTHDLIIAATARAREREVMSLDRAGFADLPGVPVADLLG
jgi:tRNA(fMet)-specific endonuclease VapC